MLGEAGRQPGGGGAERRGRWRTPTITNRVTPCGQCNRRESQWKRRGEGVSGAGRSTEAAQGGERLYSEGD